MPCCRYAFAVETACQKPFHLLLGHFVKQLCVALSAALPVTCVYNVSTQDVQALCGVHPTCFTAAQHWIL